MKVLAFAGHPDDVLIGCGGSIVKHLDRKNEVYIVYMTSGESGSLDYSKEELANIREQETIEAMKILGVPKDNLIFLHNLDGYLNYDKKNLIDITNTVRKIRPEVVYVHHSSDAHTDHKTTSRIVREAISRAAGPWFQECTGKPHCVDKVLAYEVWTPLSTPNYIEDITDYLDVKIKALQMHKSQIKDIKYDTAAKGLAAYRGVMKGKGRYAEAFELLSIDKIFD